MRSMLPLVLLIACVRPAPSEFPTAKVAATAVAKMEIAKGDPDWGTYCTTWHAGGGRWVTAGHCCDATSKEMVVWRAVADLFELFGVPPPERPKAPVYDLAIEINGSEARVAKRHSTQDLCVMKSNARAGSALALGVEPEFGARVHFIGYPEGHFGIYDGLWNGRDPAQGPNFDNHMFTAPVWGGASGSPLMDKYGRVVGVVVSSYRARPFSYAEPVAELRKFLDE